MSRAAVKSKQERRKAERREHAVLRHHELALYTSRIDSAAVTCDACGLPQVTSQGRGCFSCGHDVGTSAESLA